ncbi:MAG: hypothetical protein ABW201_13210 [Candidatus Thiodiazotropha sp.]
MNRTFQASAIRRKSLKPGEKLEEFKSAKPGTMSIDHDSIQFNDWHVSISSIKHSYRKTAKLLFWSHHQLFLTDGNYDYLFNIPNEVVKQGLPFDCEVVIDKQIMVNIFISILMISGILQVVKYVFSA